MLNDDAQRPGASNASARSVEALREAVGLTVRIGIDAIVLQRGRHGHLAQIVGMVPPAMTYSLPAINAVRCEARKAISSPPRPARAIFINCSPVVCTSVPELAASRSIRAVAAVVVVFVPAERIRRVGSAWRTGETRLVNPQLALMKPPTPHRTFVADLRVEPVEREGGDREGSAEMRDDATGSGRRSVAPPTLPGRSRARADTRRRRRGADATCARRSARCNPG